MEIEPKYDLDDKDLSASAFREASQQVICLNALLITGGCFSYQLSEEPFCLVYT